MSGSEINEVYNQEKTVLDNLQSSLNNSDVANIPNDIKEINQLNQIRNMELKNIVNEYQETKERLNERQSNIDDKNKFEDLVRSNLDYSEKQLQQLKEQNVNALRMAEINTYYSERYSGHSSLMKTVIFVFIPLLFFIVLQRRGILSSRIAGFFIFLIVLIGGVFICLKVYNLWRRSNMNYSEFSYASNKADLLGENPTVYQYDKDQLNKIYANIVPECADELCCPEDEGLVWNENEKTCSIASKSSNEASKEGFLGGNISGQPASIGTSLKEIESTCSSSWINSVSIPLGGNSRYYSYN